MAKITPTDIVGNLYKNANYEKYVVLSYEGKDSKNHFYKIKFLETGNTQLEPRRKVLAGNVKDLMKIKLLKQQEKQKKLKERARLTKTSQRAYKRFNFDNKTILSLDLSTSSTGWAIGSVSSVKRFGCISIDDDDYMRRIFLTVKAIRQLINYFKPSICIIEDTFLGMNSDVLKKLSRLVGAVLVLLQEYNIEYELIMPNSWKHYHLLSTDRTSQKAEALKSVKNLLGIEVENDDIADAILMLIYAAKNLGGGGLNERHIY